MQNVVETSKITKEHYDMVDSILPFVEPQGISNWKDLLFKAFDDYLTSHPSGMDLYLLESTIDGEEYPEDEERSVKLDAIIKSVSKIWKRIGERKVFNLNRDYVFLNGPRKGETFHIAPKAQLGSAAISTVGCYLYDTRKNVLQCNSRKPSKTPSLCLRVARISFTDNDYNHGVMEIVKISIHAVNSSTIQIICSDATGLDRYHLYDKERLNEIKRQVEEMKAQVELDNEEEYDEYEHYPFC